MEDAANLVLSKQQPDGRWLTENTYASERMLIPFEGKGAPGKWVTLRAMRAQAARSLIVRRPQKAWAVRFG